MKTVDIDVLKEHYPAEYKRAYENWVDGLYDGLNEILHMSLEDICRQELEGKGWTCDDVTFSVGFTQGDGVCIEGHVYFDEFDETTLDEVSRDFPMCLELLRRDYFEVWSYPARRGYTSLVNWVVSSDIQEFEEDEVWDGEIRRLEGGVYHGLPESVALKAADAERFDRFADDMHSRLKDAQDRAYRAIIEEIESQESEEMFIEWARNFNEEFEVEDEESVV